MSKLSIFNGDWV